MALYELGPLANMFYDPSSGLILRKGSTIEITEAHKAASPAVRRAISGGHLVLVEGVEEDPKDNTPDDEVLKDKLEELLLKGETDKAKKLFSKEALVRIAALYGLEADEKDTKDTLIEAIMAELQGVEETEEPNQS